MQLQRLTPLALVLCAHALVLAPLLMSSSPQPLPREPDVIEAVLLSAPPPAAPTPPQPKPQPPKPRPQPEKRPAPPKPQAKPLTPQPAPAPLAPSKPVETVSKPAPVAPSKPAPAAPADQPVEAPRADAAHLNNPSPPYPSLSRKLGEQGRVLLRLHVLADGSVGEVQVKQSSGYERLDQAAINTVKRWRFIPAKRGGEPIPYWYQQPISFALDS